MSTIQVKSGPSERLDSVFLTLGEFGYVTDTGQLYIGNESGEKSLLNFGGGGIGGDASTAETLVNPRYFQIVGNDATSPAVAFDGSANVSLALMLAASGVIAGTYTKVTVDEKGRILDGGNLQASDIPLITLEKISDAGTAASLDAGSSQGNVVVLGADGKISTSMLSQVIVTSVYVVNSEEEMLSIPTYQAGSLAIRTDEYKTYALMQSPADILSNWQELLSPTGLVSSVNGQTGTVIITNISGNAATATALETPRSINGVLFTATENITIYDDTKEPVIIGSTAGTFWNGLKQFVDFATSVWETIVSDLSLANTTAVSDGDTLITAIGKLQAQMNRTIKEGDIISGGEW